MRGCGEYMRGWKLHDALRGINSQKWFFALGLIVSLCLYPERFNARNNQDLLENIRHQLKASPTQALQRLNSVQTDFDSQGHAGYAEWVSLYQEALGLNKQFSEQVEFLQKHLPKFTTQHERIYLLQRLSEAQNKVGDMVGALRTINEAMTLIPQISSVSQQLDILHSAHKLFTQLRLAEPAFENAQRAFEIARANQMQDRHCQVLLDQAESMYLSARRRELRLTLDDASEACEKSQHPFAKYYLSAISVFDLEDSGNYSQAIAAGVVALSSLKNKGDESEYITKLENSLANAYLKTNNLIPALSHAERAWQGARARNSALCIEKTAETMAAIKRAQGKYSEALDFMNAALLIKNRVQDEQIQRNIAYQSVKFGTLDKVHQLNQLELKNQSLSRERELERRNNQLLWALNALVGAAAVFIFVWLLRTVKQKNIFRYFSQTDGLTEIPNRTYFFERSKDIFKKRKEPVSLVLFDLDRFKKVNDTFGHGTGDWVLKAVSQTVKAHIRRQDVIGRLGGEEFALCLPGTSPEVAAQLAERCRMAITTIETEESGYRFPLSASFGVATVDYNELASFESTLEAADKALYQSKAEGRNCVTVFN